MKHPHAIALFVLTALPALAAPGDKLEFRAEAGARVLKSFEVQHELRIDDMGSIVGDLPFVSDGTGGWISGTHRVQYLDEYTSAATGLPRDFRRAVREAVGNCKASVVFQSGETRPEANRSSSALKRQVIDFRWNEAERDWSRAYDRIDAEEDLLAELRGEFELLALLPPGEVEVGATWPVDLKRLREVLVPGGNLMMVPEGGTLFGRMMEVGIGGDFADFYEPVGGEITATYRGRRTLQAPEGTPAPAPVVNVGVVELSMTFLSLADRKYLYRMAMPQTERRENSRVESVPLEYTFAGTGELLWDLDRGRALSFRMEGAESFTCTITKTRYDSGKPELLAQRSTFSGPLKVTVSFTDGAGVELEPTTINPRAAGKGKK